MANVRTDNVQVNVEINGQKAGQTLGEMKKEAAQLYRELSKLAPGTKEFTDKAQEIKKVEATLADARKEIKGIAEETGKASRAYGLFGLNVEGLTGKMEEFAQGSSLASRAVGLINNAFKLLLANPIILVITLIVALFVKLASATDYVKDKLEQLGGGFGAVFDLLVNAVSALSSGGAAFKKFGDIIAGIGEALAGLATFDFERVRAGAAAAAGAVADIAGSFRDAFTAGMDYKAALQEIEDAENALSVERAKADRLVSNALIQVRNRTLSEQEKLAILDKASAKEQQVAQIELELAARRLEAVRKRNEAIAVGGVLQDSQVEELQAAQVAYENAAKNTENTLDKIQNRRDQLLEQEEQRRKAAADKAFAVEQANARNRAQLLEDELKKNLALFDVEAAGRVRTARQNGEDVKLLEEVLANERLKVVYDFRQKVAAEEKKRADDAKKQHDKELAEQQKRDEEYLKLLNRNKIARANLEVLQAGKNNTLLYLALINRLQAEKEVELSNTQLTADERLLIEAEYQVKLAELQDQYAQQEIDRRRAIMEATIELTQGGMQAISDFSQISTDRQLAAEERKKNQTIAKQRAELNAKRLNQQQFDNAQAAAEAEFEKKSRAIKKKQAETDKIVQVNQAIINTAVAVTAAMAKPAVPPFPSAIAAGILGGLQIAKIAATPLQYANGGIVGWLARRAAYSNGGTINPVAGVPDRGQRHSDGGIKMLDGKTGEYLGEWERGEPYMILSRNTYANNRDVIDRLLDSSLHHGGRRIYEDGGVVAPGNVAMATSASRDSSVSTGNQAADVNTSAMLMLLAEISAKVGAFPTLLKAQVSIQEVESAQTELDSIRKDSQLT